MVRLRIGRFAWELYYTRTRAVIPREEARRRAALFFGHLGYITGLFEYIMTDILWLRAFALGGCVMIVGYQLSMPKIQWLSAGWNTVFSFVNIFHIHLLLRRRPSLTHDEEGLLSALGDHITWKEFQLVLDAGEWRAYDAGSVLTREGSQNEERELCLLAGGACDVLVGDVIVGSLGPGSVVGELGALAICSGAEIGDRRSSATIVATSDLQCLCLPVAKLKGDAKLQDALQGVFAAALVAKVLAMNQESKILQYSAVLEALCPSNVEEELHPNTFPTPKERAQPKRNAG